MDLLDWITAVATVVLAFVAMRHPLHPPSVGKNDEGLL